MYKVIVWHNDSVNGTHNRVLFQAKTQLKALRDFGKYLQRPVKCFDERKNLVQLVHTDKGLICDLIKV